MKPKRILQTEKYQIFKKKTFTSDILDLLESILIVHIYFLIVQNVALVSLIITNKRLFFPESQSL